MANDLALMAEGALVVYREDDIARKMFDELLQGEADQSSTTTQAVLELMGFKDHQQSRTKITRTFRRLESLGCGRFLVGRRDHVSRFQWAVPPRLLAQEVVRLSSAPPKQATPRASEAPFASEELDGVKLVPYQFPIRGGMLTVRLPADLRGAEAQRLAMFVQSLADAS